MWLIKLGEALREEKLKCFPCMIATILLYLIKWWWGVGYKKSKEIYDLGNLMACQNDIDRRRVPISYINVLYYMQLVCTQYCSNMNIHPPHVLKWFVFKLEKNLVCAKDKIYCHFDYDLHSSMVSKFQFWPF